MERKKRRTDKEQGRKIETWLTKKIVMALACIPVLISFCHTEMLELFFLACIHISVLRRLFLYPPTLCKGSAEIGSKNARKLEGNEQGEFPSHINFIYIFT